MLQLLTTTNTFAAQLEAERSQQAHHAELQLMCSEQGWTDWWTREGEVIAERIAALEKQIDDEEA